LEPGKSVEGADWVGRTEATDAGCPRLGPAAPASRGRLTEELSRGSLGGSSPSGPAGAGEAVTCNDALVSYDLAVWDGDRPLDNRRASLTYDELYERYLESDDVVAPPAPRIVAYVEGLLARYPDDVEGSVVWASPPVIEEASGPVVYLLISYGKAEEVSEYAAELAREHGLVCFDPQGECLRP
ncbi:hypothetical protein, partial [Streptomyces sp. NPDC003832]